MNHSLYLAYEIASASLEPWQQARLKWLRALRTTCGVPDSMQDAWTALELLAALRVSGSRPPFCLDAADTSEELICELPFCSLLRFRRGAGGTPLLLVAPLSGHFASRLRETVDGLLDEHDVYVTDWHNARDVPLSAGGFDLDDYIDYLLHFLRRIGVRCHVMAICQACPPVLAASALLCEDRDDVRPLGLALLCGPIDPRINPTAIGYFARSMPISWFMRNMTSIVPAQFSGAGRRVAPGFLQVPSLSWSESSSRLLGLAQSCAGFGSWDQDRIKDARQGCLDEFSLMDLSAEYYLATIRSVFHDAALARGRYSWRGRRVHPDAIVDCGLVTIEAGRDDVCGAGQTHPAHELCPALPQAYRTRITQRQCGHLGLFTGPVWQAAVRPALRAAMKGWERVGQLP